MKKLYPLLSVLFLIYWGCEEEQDTTPPTVSITSPQDGSTVSDSVIITCMSSDNEGVEKVELWVNGVSTGVTDDTEPYSLVWNTTIYEYGEYTIIVRSYDESGNITDSDPITLTVDNSIYLWGEYYSIENTISIGLGSRELTGSIPPEIGNLTNLTNLYLDLNQLTGSIPPEIGNLINLTNLNLGHNQLTGPIPSEIGNLINLTTLALSSNQLTGSIPPEIGNLTNLWWLGLDDNQLTGIIPDEICNQGDSSPSLSNNQLCPPYPSCIEDYVGEQDTSDCP
jgi:hypothetical protein